MSDTRSVRRGSTPSRIGGALSKRRLIYSSSVCFLAVLSVIAGCIVDSDPFDYVLYRNLLISPPFIRYLPIVWAKSRCLVDIRVLRLFQERGCQGSQLIFLVLSSKTNVIRLQAAYVCVILRDIV